MLRILVSEQIFQVEILANTLTLKLKWNENISVILAIDILLMVMNLVTFARYLVRMSI